jgi:hypothetical protein
MLIPKAQKSRAKTATSGTAGRSSRSSSQIYYERANFLTSQREEIMRELALAQSRGQLDPALIWKMRTLLTRHWARAKWRARGEILQAARWLMQVAKLQSLASVPELSLQSIGPRAGRSSKLSHRRSP